jgi:molybdopterin-guanine dinucleotide biosynthesis protein A
VRAVILTGGASRRMGRPKAWLEIGGRSLLARVRAACLEAGFRVEFQGDLPGVPEAFPGDPVHADPRPGEGPLASLASALGRSGPLLLLACDLPFLSPPLLRDLAAELAGADWAAPAAGEQAHPLCAAYGPAVLAPARELLRAGRRDMHSLLAHPGLRGRLLAPRPAWGDPERLLLNVNTPEDLERARRLAAT